MTTQKTHYGISCSLMMLNKQEFEFGICERKGFSEHTRTLAEQSGMRRFRDRELPKPKPRFDSIIDIQ